MTTQYVENEKKRLSDRCICWMTQKGGVGKKNRGGGIRGEKKDLENNKAIGGVDFQIGVDDVGFYVESRAHL